jgi:hypothetical protein
MSDLFHGLRDGRALLVVFLSLAWHAVSPQYRRIGQCVSDRSDEGKQCKIEAVLAPAFEFAV